MVLAASRQNLSSGFQTRSDTNRAVQPQQMAKDLAFGSGFRGILLST